MTNKDNGENFEDYFQWSRSYFGHVMPPSQNYYESTMSAWQAAILASEKKHQVPYGLLVNGAAKDNERINELEKENAELKDWYDLEYGKRVKLEAKLEKAKDALRFYNVHGFECALQVNARHGCTCKAVHGENALKELEE
jgi:hypothetical protein